MRQFVFLFSFVFLLVGDFFAVLVLGTVTVMVF